MSYSIGTARWEGVGLDVQSSEWTYNHYDYVVQNGIHTWCIWFIHFSKFVHITDLWLLPARTSEQGKVIGVGVHTHTHTHTHTHICICLWTKKKIVAIDSPFQTFAVGLLIEFID